jgi:hypothetical protein
VQEVSYVLMTRRGLTYSARDKDQMSTLASKKQQSSYQFSFGQLSSAQDSSPVSQRASADVISPPRAQNTPAEVPAKFQDSCFVQCTNSTVCGFYRVSDHGTFIA